jgi:Ser/Thr protein kinase RdoA (MazF antagonist)
MENAAIEYAVSRGFSLDLPKVLENHKHNLETRIKMHRNDLYRLRIIHFIEGSTLSSIPDISVNLLQSVGKSLARFCEVMQGFDHPAARRDHRWNLATAGRHEKTIQWFGDRQQQELLAWAFGGWRGAQGCFDSLHWQFVHGDAHDENWMVEQGRVTGLIDFGDCCHNPAICDLAICLAYLMMRGAEPLPIAAAVSEGYQEVRALAADELSVLYPLICARLAVSLCVAMERKAIDPSNPNWFGGEESAWRLLRQLRALGQGEFLKSLP